MTQSRSFLLLVTLLLLVMTAPAALADPTKAPKEPPFELKAQLVYSPTGPLRTENVFYQGEKVFIRYRVQLNPNANTSWKGIAAGHILNNAQGHHEILYGAIDLVDHVKPGEESFVDVFEVKTSDLELGQYTVNVGAYDSETDTSISFDIPITVVPYPEPEPTKILVLNYPSRWLYGVGERSVVEVQLMAKLPQNQAPRWHIVAKMKNTDSGKTVTIHDGSLEKIFNYHGHSLKEGRVLFQSNINIPLRLNHGGKWQVNIHIEEQISQTSKDISFPLVIIDSFDEAAP